MKPSRRADMNFSLRLIIFSGDFSHGVKRGVGEGAGHGRKPRIKKQGSNRSITPKTLKKTISHSKWFDKLRFISEQNRSLIECHVSFLDKHFLLILGLL